jgi:hypothetical protein
VSDGRPLGEQHNNTRSGLGECYMLYVIFWEFWKVMQKRYIKEEVLSIQSQLSAQFGVGAVPFRFILSCSHSTTEYAPATLCLLTNVRNTYLAQNKTISFTPGRTSRSPCTRSPFIFPTNPPRNNRPLFFKSLQPIGLLAARFSSILKQTHLCAILNWSNLQEVVL